MAQLVKNLPVMQETWVRSLGWEDPLEKEKATHSSILAWRTPWAISFSNVRFGGFFLHFYLKCFTITLKPLSEKNKNH